MATDKQVNLLLKLIADKGHDTRHMGSSHKALGATMSERRGTVADWLRGLDTARASALIDQLKLAPREEPEYSPEWIEGAEQAMEACKELIRGKGSPESVERAMALARKALGMA